MIAAQRKGYEVLAIELYPIHGFVRFQAPWSGYDEALIAWGGGAAQEAVALPLVTFCQHLWVHEVRRVERNCRYSQLLQPNCRAF